MAKTKEPKKMGRPRIEIDWEEFDKLCKFQATLIEIAGWFDCSVDTIENRVKETHGETFSEYSKKKSAGGKASLRRKQFKAADKGSIPMLIWLGKQYLGQSDKLDQNTKVLAKVSDEPMTPGEWGDKYAGGEE